jgi:DNA-binding NarL/FixJ family response regulator
VCDEPNSGLVLVWALRQNHPSLPIVVVTTWDDRTVIDELLEHELWVVLEQGVPTEVAVATMLNAVPARGGHTQVAV